MSQDGLAILAHSMTRLLNCSATIAETREVYWLQIKSEMIKPGSCGQDKADEDANTRPNDGKSDAIALGMLHASRAPLQTHTPVAYFITDVFLCENVSSCLPF